MSSKIKLALGVVLVVVLVVVGITLLTGGDDDDKSPTSASQGGGGGDGGDDGDAPDLRTVAVDRAKGKNATSAIASPSIKGPKEIWLRVSAAPAQKVTGTWNVSCGSGNVATDTFDVKPPHLQKLTIPGKNPVSCIAGASAQLDRSGRLKLTILRDR
jgi:hypothetical protein